jgi:hypothetical protein
MVKSIIFFVCLVLCAISTEINSPILFAGSFVFGVCYIAIAGGIKFDKDLRDTHKW